jgi:sulfur carrier protein ThiS
MTMIFKSTFQKVKPGKFKRLSQRRRLWHGIEAVPSQDGIGGFCSREAEVVKIVFFPPIGDRIHNVEYCTPGVDGDWKIANLIEHLRTDPVLVSYFDRMRQYGLSDNLLESLLVLVNGSVADESSRVRDGDLVKILLPLAGG